MDHVVMQVTQEMLVLQEQVEQQETQVMMATQATQAIQELMVQVVQQETQVMQV